MQKYFCSKNLCKRILYLHKLKIKIKNTKTEFLLLSNQRIEHIFFRGPLVPPVRHWTIQTAANIRSLYYCYQSYQTLQTISLGSVAVQAEWEIGPTVREISCWPAPCKSDENRRALCASAVLHDERASDDWQGRSTAFLPFGRFRHRVGLPATKHWQRGELKLRWINMASHEIVTDTGPLHALASATWIFWHVGGL